MADLSLVFSALSEPIRMEIVERLRDGPKRPSVLAEDFEMSRPAMSRHLRALRNSGLVAESSSPDDARARVYRLNAQGWDPLQTWLDEISGAWSGQLDAFKAYAESRDDS